MNIQPFDFQGHEVRVIADNPDRPLWVASDVAKVLGYSATAAMTRTLDADEADMHNLHIRSENGVEQERSVTVITESGLYAAILKSRRPEAAEFRRWVTGEILPSIRKHGAYMTPAKIEAVLADPDTIIELATRLKTEQQARRALEQEAAVNAPKVIFADAVSASKTSILVGDLAKLLKQNGVNVGANRLFVWLRGNGFLISRKGMDWNMPTQRAMEMQLFTVKETAVTHSDGHVTVSKTPKVTGKGQAYFVSRFLDGRFQLDAAA